MLFKTIPSLRENYKKQESEGFETKSMVCIAKNPDFESQLCNLLGGWP